MCKGLKVTKFWSKHVALLKIKKRFCWRTLCNVNWITSTSWCLHSELLVEGLFSIDVSGQPIFSSYSWVKRSIKSNVTAWTSWLLKLEPIGCHETSTRNKILEECRLRSFSVPLPQSYSNPHASKYFVYYFLPKIPSVHILTLALCTV